MPTKPADPYAPPPLKKDRIGGLVRVAIVAALLLGAGAVAYSVMQTPSQMAANENQNAPQQLADGSYATRDQAVAPATQPPREPNAPTGNAASLPAPAAVIPQTTAPNTGSADSGQ